MEDVIVIQMKRKNNQKLKNKAREFYIKGKSQREIGKLLNIPWQSVWPLIKDIKMEQREKIPQKGVLMKIPEKSREMSNAKARIIAYLSAEGFVCETKSKNVLKYEGKKGKTTRVSYGRKTNISFYNKESSVINQFIKDVKEVYGFDVKFNRRRSEVKIYRADVFNDLINYTDFGSRRWIIPKEIQEGKKSWKSNWLKAFCDGEAHIESKDHKRVIISSSNGNGLKQIQKLLLDLRIESRFNGPYAGCYRIRISKNENILRFKDEIGFFHKIKKKKLNCILSNKTKRL